MSENRSKGKCFLKRVKSIMTREVEIPENVLLDEIYQYIRGESLQDRLVERS